MTRDDLPEDELMARLDAVLHDEARRYEPSTDSLALIQARVPATARRTALRWLAPLAAAAVIVGIAAAVVVAPRGDHTATPLPGTSNGLTQSPQPTPTPSLSSPAPSADPSPSATKSQTVTPPPPQHSPSSQPADTGCRGAGKRGYAYYASDLNGIGPRLYRGTVTVTCHLGIEEALTIPAGKDPDFVTLWPAGTQVLSMSIVGGMATVDLSAFPETTRENETAAMQQLVWTVTANDPSISSVRVKVNGAPPVANLDWTKANRRGNSLVTLSNVWIISPGEGSTNGSPVTVRIYGTGYEGLVPLKVFQDGAEVASGSVTTRMGGFAEGTTSFDLPPGTYELRAYNDNGENSDLTLWDTKVFTVS